MQESSVDNDDRAALIQRVTTRRRQACIISFMGESVPGIIRESPIKYVHDAQLRGRLFGYPESPSISSVFTSFRFRCDEHKHRLMEYQLDSMPA